jgi:peptidoglycan/LPS O-acetylase OafA/YrhL
MKKITATYFARLFSRPSQNYKPIDGIRAIAVLWVIIFHAWLFQYNDLTEVGEKVLENPFLIWISKGDLGVDLFFVISGFLIGTILFKEFKRTNQLNFKKFYVRRILRLLPVYVFSMLIGLYFIEGDNWKSAWSNLLYINNYVRGSYMGWTWSLAIEEQFYIVIPFLIAFIFPFFKRKAILFGLLTFITIALTYHYSVNIHDFQVPFKSSFLDEDWENWFWEYYMLTHLRYGGLLCGVIGAYINVYYPERIKAFFNEQQNLASILFCLSFVVFIIISFVSLGQWTNLQNSIFDGLPNSIPRTYEILHREIFSYAVLFIIFCCLYLDSKIVKPMNSFLSMKFFYPISQISYSAYLFHEMFMFWLFPQFNEFALGRLSETQIFLGNGLISLLAILLASTLMYMFIEQPFQDIKQKIKFVEKQQKGV